MDEDYFEMSDEDEQEIEEHAPEPDFVQKYGALLHILEGGEEDFEYLAAKEHYTPELGRDFRNLYCRSIIGYLRSIRTDFEVLYQQTGGRSLLDEDLGNLLGNTEARLKRIERRLRWYAFLQRLAPMPGAWPLRSAARALISMLLPKNVGGDLRDLLYIMRDIHHRHEVRIFIP